MASVENGSGRSARIALRLGRGVAAYRGRQLMRVTVRYLLFALAVPLRADGLARFIGGGEIVGGSLMLMGGLRSSWPQAEAGVSSSRA